MKEIDETPIEEQASVQEDVSLQDKNFEEEHLTLEQVTPKLEKWWFQYPFLLKLNILLLGGILAQITSGYDGSMMNNLQTLPSWQGYFNKPKGAILGTMSNGISIGTLITTPFVSNMSDFLGRRWTIIAGCLVVILGSGIQAGANSFGMFVGARILLGVGSCLASAAAQPLLAETAYPSQRPVVTAFLLASWPLGSFVAALVTWGPYHSSMKTNNWSWRLPSLLQAVFPFIELVLAILGPESPRWLIKHGHIDRATKIFADYHVGGDPNHPLVKFEVAEIIAALEQEKLSTNISWKMWIKNKQSLRRLFIVLAVPAMQQLCGNAIISYYLSIVLSQIGITDTLAKLKINLGMTVYGLVWSVGCASLVGRFKRKSMFIVGYGSMCLSYIIWTILSARNQINNFADKGLAYGVVTMIYIFSGFYHITSPVAGNYVMEICPYTLRAQGAMLYQLSGNVVGFFNNYVNPIAMAAIKWKYYIVWCIWLVVQMNIVYWIFPETKGLGLEEVAKVFGEDITQTLVAGDQALNYDDDVNASLPDEKHHSNVKHVEKV